VLDQQSQTAVSVWFKRLSHIADPKPVDRVADQETVQVIHRDRPVARGRELTWREAQDVLACAVERVVVGVGAAEAARGCSSGRPGGHPSN
jgi:hypothetical protein